MEKETYLDEKGGVLPTPAASHGEANAAHAQTQRSKRLRRVAAFGFIFLLSTSGFSYIRRSAREYRANRLVHSFANPDLRGKLTVDQAEEHFLTIPNEASAIETSKQYSLLPHIAGSPQDLETAKYFLEVLQTELGITPPDELPIFDAGSSESQDATRGLISRRNPSAWIDKYFPVMNYPVSRALELIDDEGGVESLETEEPVLSGDPSGVHARDIGAWHGLSAAGDVTGKAVYVNYGRKKDFDELLAAGVNLTGTIAVARYGGIFRGLKVKAAQEAGCVATLIYTDPRDHGAVTEENGYAAYPDGPAVNPDSVQRGSVQYLSTYPGDPTTPGAPAYENATRLDGGNVPHIPSLPISWNNGKKILSDISDDPFHLDGALSKKKVRVMNNVDNRVIPIWNTMGVIPGHIKDEIVVVGNHRDAWVTGAADPTSGTVSMVEIVKGFGSLLRKGWTPLRTIVIASWDAEEYGLIGSTEFGEDYADFLGKHVVAYLNVDVSSAGSKLALGGSPSLAHLVKGVATSLPHPNHPNRTLWDARDDQGPYTGPGPLARKGESADITLGIDHIDAMELRAQMDADPISTGVSPLGSGSDYTVFLQRLGIASIDGGFKGTHSDPVYHYHSVYDSHRWQEVYSDPGFFKHTTWSKYLGLVTLRMADSIVLPINTTQYTLELDSYLTKVEHLVETSNMSPKPDLKSLRKSINKLQKASTKLDKAKFKAEKALRKVLTKIGKPKHRKHHAKVCVKRRFRKIRMWIKSVFGVPPSERELAEVAPHHHLLPRPGVTADHIRPFEERSTDDELTHEKRAVSFDSIRVGHAGAGAWTPPSKREFESEEPHRGPGKRSDRPHLHSHSRSGCTRKKTSPHAWVWDAVTPSNAPSNSTSVPHLPHLPKKKAIRRLIKAAKAVRAVNDKLSHFESGFISEAGIKDREWYRHLGVAPGKWLGYGATTFPALTEALDEGNSTLASDEAERLAKLVGQLAKFLDV